MSPPLRLVGGGARNDRSASVTASASGGLPSTHTQRPMVTGSSILGMRCADGVVLASDTLASYGSLARFRDVSRLHEIGRCAAMGVGGDVSDMQELVGMVGKMGVGDYVRDDGFVMGSREIYEYVGRVMYNKRNKMDPLWNYVVFAGCEEGKPFLGQVDLCGGHFESEVIATGYGLHMGLPLLREKWYEGIGVVEGEKVLAEIMKVLFYRDARTSDRVQTAVITETGVVVREAEVLETKWDYKAFVSGARAGAV